MLQISEFNLLSRNHCHLSAQIFIWIFFFQMSLKALSTCINPYSANVENRVSF